MNVRLLTLTAMIATVCALGALVKIPVGISSAALDVVPALISVTFLPPILSGIAAMIGHIVSSLTAGMPLGPFHLVIALEMLVILGVFAKLHRAKRHVVKWIFFVIANSVLAPLPFYFLIGSVFYFAAVPALFLASCINAAFAFVLVPIVEQVYKRVVVK